VARATLQCFNFAIRQAQLKRTHDFASSVVPQSSRFAGMSLKFGKEMPLYDKSKALVQAYGGYIRDCDIKRDGAVKLREHALNEGGGDTAPSEGRMHKQPGDEASAISRKTNRPVSVVRDGDL